MNFRAWNKIYRWRWAIGIVFTPISLISYPMFGTSNTIYGFPLMVAVFDKNGTDFVGPTTAPFAIINIIICYFMLQIVLYVWSRFLTKASNKSSERIAKDLVSYIQK